MGFLERQTRDQVKAFPIEGSHHMWRDIGALGKLPGLKQQLRTIEQSCAGVERDPDRQGTTQDLMIAARKLDLRKLADHDRVMRLRALEVLQSGNDCVKGK